MRSSAVSVFLSGMSPGRYTRSVVIDRRGRARRATAFMAVAAIISVLGLWTSVLAQDADQVGTEGVPTEAVEAAEAVGEVEEAMEQVEAETAEGLPAEFTIQFGDTYDWLRLTSGEWLKGRLKRLREDEIEFDSDKLNLVTFEWGKVDRLHCPQVNTYVFEDKLDIVGRAVITADKVLIETDTPYLAPVPHRGKENQPSFVIHVAEMLAELWNRPLQGVAETTAANFESLFGVQLTG